MHLDLREMATHHERNDRFIASESKEPLDALPSAGESQTKERPSQYETSSADLGLKFRSFLRAIKRKYLSVPNTELLSDPMRCIAYSRGCG